MKIVIIGAGRVATNLAPALQQSGAQVLEVWSKHRATAETLAARVGCKAVWGDLSQVTCEADLYVIAVKDSALAEVVSALHPGREDALMVHTAGSMPLSLFADAGHVRGGVFYPMQTFSKERSVDFTQVHFFIEASQTEDEAALFRLAGALTRNEAFVHRSTSAMRRRLHLAAVFACNFTNHCCTLADKLLDEVGLDFKVMLPLLDETVAKLHQLPPSEAQTGPAARHDENVMGLQHAMLTDQPEIQRIYDMMSKSIKNSIT
ncbi:MAG: DUF2520 domain-containing protein [Bacteroidales bacterium]|nr:DUF2520 domain-containing protein [Bacteroidales bacterium]